jgi:hypothetical protein
VPAAEGSVPSNSSEPHPEGKKKKKKKSKKKHADGTTTTEQPSSTSDHHQLHQQQQLQPNGQPDTPTKAPDAAATAPSPAPSHQADKPTSIIPAISTPDSKLNPHEKLGEDATAAPPVTVDQRQSTFDQRLSTVDQQQGTSSFPSKEEKDVEKELESKPFEQQQEGSSSTDTEEEKSSDAPDTLHAPPATGGAISLPKVGQGGKDSSTAVDTPDTGLALAGNGTAVGPAPQKAEKKKRKKKKKSRKVDAAGALPVDAHIDETATSAAVADD